MKRITAAAVLALCCILAGTEAWAYSPSPISVDHLTSGRASGAVVVPHIRYSLAGLRDKASASGTVMVHLRYSSAKFHSPVESSIPLVESGDETMGPDVGTPPDRVRIGRGRGVRHSRRSARKSSGCSAVYSPG